MAPEKNRGKSVWHEDFEDIRSHSREPRNTGRTAPRASGQPTQRSGNTAPRRNRQSRDWDLPDWEVSSRNRTGRTGSPERRRTAAAGPDRRPAGSRPAPPKKKRKPPMRPGVRRVLTVFAVLAMTAVTLLLVAFLAFKVSGVDFTGDTVPGFDRAGAMELCGFMPGDNLLLIPTKEKEALLEQTYPYVAEAKITRRLPDTVEIQLTAATPAASVATGSGWLIVSDTGKILEQADAPAQGVLQVTGLNVEEPTPGTFLSAEDAPLQALKTVMETISAQDAVANFTRLDLTDLTNISLYYQDRVVFKLGGVLSLDYKVELGCRAAADLRDADKGVLDLASSPETRRAVFTTGAITLPGEMPAPSPTPVPETDDTPPEAPEDGDGTDDAPEE